MRYSANLAVNGLLLAADDILRRRARAIKTNAAAIVTLLALIALFGMLYGTAMGSYGGLRGPGALQMLYSGIKVPLLLLATFVLSLPSFFVVNSLLGLRKDLQESLRALVATQAGLAVILASLSPYTLLWYASVERYSAAVLFNAMMFGIASVTAQWVLRAYYRPLIQRNRRHLWMLRSWIGIYAFVGIQMGWMLRPFIGDPETPVQFFRHDPLTGNAYVVVAKLFWHTLIK